MHEVGVRGGEGLEGRTAVCRDRFDVGGNLAHEARENLSRAELEEVPAAGGDEGLDAVHPPHGRRHLGDERPTNALGAADRTA